VLGGWASGSTYPLLGGLRAAAQMISYDVAMGLSFVAVFLYAGTLSTSAIVAQQEPGWYVWLLPVSFIVYCVSMVGETNRAPFDLAEAEGELVGGFNTEYSSMRFGLFFLAEYINLINVSAIATTLFLGGWRAPWPFSLFPWANEGYWTMAWFFVKVLLFMFAFVWLRGTLPRIRYDQFMSIGWKVLIPVSLVWIVLVGAVRVLRNAEGYSTTEVLLWVGVPLAVVLVAAVAWPGKKQSADDEAEDEYEESLLELAESQSGDPTVVPAGSGGRYPVPPMDLKVPIPPIRAVRAAEQRAADQRAALQSAGVSTGSHELPGGSDVIS
jgi:NADH-quinone oxidoreductase subunit H